MTAAEKRETIRLVEESDLPVRRTLREIQIPPASFYRNRVFVVKLTKWEQ